MDHITFVPTPEQFAFTFGGAEPVMRIKPRTALRLWTEDAYGGRITSADDIASSALDTEDLNPQTGPFWIEGAEPGDTLAVHLVDLTPARGWGASTLIPFFGGLTSVPVNPTLQEPLPERTWIYEYDSATHTVGFSAHGSNFEVALPANPMLGTVGVAPARREVRTSLVPDVFGGNMDTPEMTAGATCYLRVNVPGALFSLGDGHYRQGEGESCGTAVEGAMNVTAIVDLIKGGGPAWPRLETDTHLMCIGSGRPLEEAWRAGQVEMITWLGELYGLDRFDAYQLLTQISLAPIANVVDTNYSSVTKIEKKLLPTAAAYGGVHAELRSAAKTLGSITY
ncbi:Acetamidase/formamidase [Mycolicibacterium neoaurum]|uniref:Acetamidase/formamidase n=1 Tax=Mycolicibacterium neoaurum TaxID=1795 RepID=A0AAV2WH29_MYCNE|nr:acetamidase/formamidase family protein [Mycolicibacterium neoaurum]TLH56758.1 acetamidase [Mycolicibacterium neoaurum]CDQ43511.1 acetamidase/formamidase [Mycolicibacterium neoaurum]SDE91357.1 Acetamidase/formamidase [Mycolicibacterium neoaurum]